MILPPNLALFFWGFLPLAALLILWGRENFQWDFVLPVVTAAALYGALLRIPPGSVAE